MRQLLFRWLSFNKFSHSLNKIKFQIKIIVWCAMKYAYSCLNCWTSASRSTTSASWLFTSGAWWNRWPSRLIYSQTTLLGPVRRFTCWFVASYVLLNCQLSRLISPSPNNQGKHYDIEEPSVSRGKISMKDGFKNKVSLIFFSEFLKPFCYRLLQVMNYAMPWCPPRCIEC